MKNHGIITGAFLALVYSTFTSGLQAQQNEPVFEAAWPGLSYPRDVAIASDGSVLVTESGTVRRFDVCGTELDSWSNGQLIQGIAIDGDDNVFLAHNGMSCVRVFGIDGTFMYEFGSIGNGDGQCQSGPRDLAIAPNGNVYLADTNNHRITVYESTGVFLFSWGTYGQENGEFNSPRGIAVDGLGNVYVVDGPIAPETSYRARIQKFSAAGQLLTSWFGTEPYTQSAPGGIGVDAQGSVYVTIELSAPPVVVRKYDPTGKCIASWRGGNPQTYFSEPNGVAISVDGNVFVADSANSRIQKYIQPFVLGCPAGDVDGDCDVDAADFIAMTINMTGPLQPAIVVDAGCLAGGLSSAGSYFSNGNDLRAYATQRGYDVDDWTISWAVESKPLGSGAVAIFDPNQLESAFVITAPAVAGEYLFRLTVSNVATGTDATDVAVLTLAP